MIQVDHLYSKIQYTPKNVRGILLVVDHNLDAIIPAGLNQIRCGLLNPNFDDIGLVLFSRLFYICWPANVDLEL